MSSAPTHSPPSDESSSLIITHSPPSDQTSFIITELLKTELHHLPDPDYLRLCRDRPILLTSRHDSINSILKAHSHHRFKPVTASLAINFFDRFLSLNTLPESSGWPFQLVAVACLSIAAKMEEVYVPLIVDLQVIGDADDDDEQSKAFRYVFEPKVVQRMELCVMSSLRWRLRSVTPFDYLDCFVVSDYSDSTVESIVSNLIINTTRVIDFLGFPPSVIAAASVISAGVDGTIDDRVNKEMVRSCHQLMDEYLLDTCPSEGLKVVTSIEPHAPPSPMGVLDAAACVSCETNSEQGNNKRRRLSATDVHEPRD